jgi:predicted DNA-binding helix-hairpin-helix protein
MLQARRVRRLRAADLMRLHVPVAKVLPFVELADHRPGKPLHGGDPAAAALAAARMASARQASLFDFAEPTAGPPSR